ncbi:MAG: hypothetical protein H7Y00_06330 [Fimbriimonadaceae bacterium]|nr:hypothetical protein [Chitinophagales bacterium]
MRFNLLLFFSLAISFASAQQSTLYLNRNIYNFYDPALNEKGVYFHTAIKPYRIAEMDSIIQYDFVFRLQKLSGDKFFGKVWNWIAYDNMVQVNQPDFHLTIDPFINFTGGLELEAGKGVWTNTRGLTISGDIGEKKKVSFTTTARENQAKVPDYLAEFITTYNVFPGQGKVRAFKDKGSNKFDYANATGYVSYTPSKYFNFQLGHDKNFIGDGYRSMLLSDNALYYPFFKITTSVWKFKYMNLYTEFDDAMNADSIDAIIGVTRKWGSFHYLSFDAFDWAQIGVFEGILWPQNDSVKYRGFDFNYINPIIFFRPIEFGLGSPDNAVIGANIKLKPIDDLILYGQFMLDDLDVAAARNGKGFYRNKFGVQAGIKYFLHTDDYKHSGVVQVELDQANPYTYAHKEPVQNYAHYNQPLAHPLGANFREINVLLNYRGWYRYYADIKLQHAIIGYDTSATSHVGSNIFVSDFTIPGFPDSYGNEIGQGLKTTIKSADLRGGFLLNPKINLNIEGQIFIRNFENAIEKQNTVLFMLALKTDLFNSYYDF